MLNVKETKKDFLLTGSLLLALCGVLFSCAADPRKLASSSSGSQTSIEKQNAYAESLAGVKLSFHHSDFYSLSSPKVETSCAGDAKNFYDPFVTGSSPIGAAKFTADILDSTATVRPAFIKNVSVDLTDANSTVSGNLASACSLTGGPSASPVSTCATFDYGAIGGIPTTMGGTLLLIGGIQDYNYAGRLPAALQITFPYQSVTSTCGPVLPMAQITVPTGYNKCATTAYALAVDSLPASTATNPPSTLAPGLISATEAISSFVNLVSTTYTGPAGLAGASATYNSDLQKVAVFGGTSPLTGTGAYGPGVDLFDTWILDLKNQAWSKLSNNVFVDAAQMIMRDINTPQVLFLTKPVGARMLHGYTPAQGMSVTRMSINGLITPIDPVDLTTTSIDLTDRLITVGGVGSASILADSHKFNPTFGPELVDTQVRAPSGLLIAHPADPVNPVASGLSQWIDSYHTQFLSNSDALIASNRLSLFVPDFNITGTPKLAVNFNIAALRNNVATGGLYFGAGFLTTAGGFDSATDITTPAQDGALMLHYKMGAKAVFAGNPSQNYSSNYGANPNINDIAAAKNTPSLWTQFTGGAANVPWYGGSTVVNGFNVQLNDLVYFAGADCKKYLSDPAAVCTNFANAGRYWRFSADPDSANALPAAQPAVATLTTFAFTGAPPPRAGMAVARGEDPSGNPVIVAWGGMSAANTATDPNVYYLYNNGGNLVAPVPTWATYTPAAPGPNVAGNGALVYSHVTRKFYLFGGYAPTAAYTSGDTWELTITGNTCGTTGACQFAWKQLNVAGGLTCYPNCPPARRSHRMAEANYFNKNPGGVITTASGTQTCTGASPCSYGIFLEGGTTDGINPIVDRWMFDPTANGSRGHWQRAEELPPRKLAAMTTVDYYIPSTNAIAHRAVLFGGETAMHAAEVASGSFVAPTLGDTYMFDYINNSWNRVTLLGKGYNVGAPLGLPANQLTGLSETEARQAYSVAVPGTLNELTPPPLSGAIMVTRTMPRTTVGAQGAIKPLKIPEVYLFGGRTKDGKFYPINRVHKFCAGSTGEKPFYDNGGGTIVSPKGQPIVAQPPAPSVTYDDASCDAFDTDLNPNSQSPAPSYVGRWIRKSPQAWTIATSDANANPGPITVPPDLLSARITSFLGAGVYDPVNDRIVLVSGLKGRVPVTNIPPAITDNANTSTLAADLPDDPSIVYEYTPPVGTNLKLPPNGRNNAMDTEGIWTAIPVCAGSLTPTPRFGHSLSFDTVTSQLIMIGGYDKNGAPLTQSLTYYDGRTYTVPDAWKAVRKTSASIPTVCYTWSRIQTFGNSIDSTAQAPPQSGIGHAAAVYIPSSGFNSGYYSMFDSACTKAGPIASSDPTINKLLAGGAYIDIDRSKLGANENLLLSITYIPMGLESKGPNAVPLSAAESAFFKIHLMRTGATGDSLRTVYQPRHLAYASTDDYPHIADTISVLAPPTGYVRQDQIFIPLGIDPTIDRIRIERYSGTGILIDASLHRMGSR